MTPGNARRDPAASFSVPSSASLPALADACRRRLARGTGVFALLGLFLLQTFGCGISGGSIPTGGTRLAGRVVRADDPTQPLADTEITVQATPPGQASRFLQTTTDQDGRFAFAQVPTGTSTARVEVSIHPNVSDYRASQWVFTLKNQRPATLIAAQPPASFDIQRVKSLAIFPANPTIHVGDSIRFSVQARDQAGSVLPITPTLLFDGDFGVIASDGTFTSTQTGSGTVTAYWYGGLTFSTGVTANLTAPHLPPPPPRQE